MSDQQDIRELDKLNAQLRRVKDRNLAGDIASAIKNWHLSELDKARRIRAICETCGGDGFYSDHDEPITHRPDGECTSCPVQVQCDRCEAKGYNDYTEEEWQKLQTSKNESKEDEVEELPF